MIDFHTHSILSDGALIPSELVRRACNIGYRAIGLADHADGSNLDWLVPRLVKVAGELNRFQETFVIPGIEITHAPPGQIAELVDRARKLGAVFVVVHGESPVEPVAPGTNRAGIEAGADILAHPGFVSPAEARLAADKGVFLEITARAGHSITNGHVATTAFSQGARLIVNTDTHDPGDLITRESALKILVGAGMTESKAEQVLKNNEDLLKTLKGRFV
ncbi:MAG: histidinol phosphate phosphatase domain-containing protein [Desulfomonilaceae bacterium]